MILIHYVPHSLPKSWLRESAVMHGLCYESENGVYLLHTCWLHLRKVCVSHQICSSRNEPCLVLASALGSAPVVAVEPCLPANVYTFLEKGIDMT